MEAWSRVRGPSVLTSKCRRTVAAEVSRTGGDGVEEAGVGEEDVDFGNGVFVS